MKLLKKIFIGLAVLILLIVSAYYLFPGMVISSMNRMARFSAGLELHEITAADHTWAYLDGGNGEVVIFIHGFGMNKDLWGAVLPAFSRSFRVIAPDLPGFGETGFRADEMYTCAKQAERLEEFFKKLELQSFHLVGCSASGGITGYYAAKYPGRVKSLILIGPFGVQSKVKSDFQKAFDKGEIPLIFRTPAEYDLAMTFLVVKPQPLPGHFKSYIAGEGAKTYNFYSRMLKTVIDTEGWDMLRKHLHNIQCPTLVIFGDKDRVFDVTCIDIFKKETRNVKTCIMKDTGHLTYMDRPDETNNVIRNFLNENMKQ